MLICLLTTVLFLPNVCVLLFLSLSVCVCVCVCVCVDGNKPTRYHRRPCATSVRYTGRRMGPQILCDCVDSGQVECTGGCLRHNTRALGVGLTVGNCVGQGSAHPSALNEDWSLRCGKPLITPKRCQEVYAMHSWQQSDRIVALVGHVGKLDRVPLAWAQGGTVQQATTPAWRFCACSITRCTVCTQHPPGMWETRCALPLITGRAHGVRHALNSYTSSTPMQFGMGVVTRTLSYPLILNMRATPSWRSDTHILRQLGHQ